MTDTHRRLVEIVCDGDRRPNLSREWLTVEDMIVAHRIATEGGEQGQ